ncbi:MAG: PAS domain-containing protein [Alphaproteobacteria bacterium]|nr:PAS domain-containing protein [Alphaproteobacteria bacterium]MCD8520142.1 PAS domain-containing protein [Alphaproteobacteria bacterium]
MSNITSQPFAFSIRDADFPAPHADSSDDALPRFVMDEKGTVIYATPSLLDLYDVKDMQGVEKLLKLTSSPRKKLHTLKEGVYELAHKKAAGPITFRFDWIDRPDGGKILVASHITEDIPAAKNDDAREMEGFVESLEEKLLKISQHPSTLWNRDDMSHFIGISSDMMVTMDISGTLLKAGPIFCDLTGLDSASIKETSFPSLFCDTDRPLVRRTIQALSLQGSDSGLVDSIDFEARMTPDGTAPLWSEWKLRREDNKIYAIGRDISAVKAHEQDLVKRQQQLLEAENIGHMGHWRWVVGEDTMEWSDQIYRMYGRTRGEFTPTIDSLNQIIHRRDVGRVIQAFQRAMIEQNTYDMDFRITRPDGETRYIQCEGRCELDTQGEVIALFGIMQDMTERMAYEKKSAGSQRLC